MVIYVELPGSSDACEGAISRHICGFSKLNNIDTTRSSQVHGAIFIWLRLLLPRGVAQPIITASTDFHFRTLAV